MGAVSESRQDNQPEHRIEVRCPYCQRLFPSQDDLTLHIVTRHTQVGIRRSAKSHGDGSAVF